MTQPCAAVQEMSQLGAPLHWMVQLLAQLTMVHVWAPWHVSEQFPPAQSISHVPLVHVSVQLPCVHPLMTHSVVPLHVCTQSPCAHPPMAHELPPLHVCVQSPPVQSAMAHVASVHIAMQSPVVQVSPHVEPAEQT
jgi:hypothetical protein